jgi:hypothetical protein
MHGQEQCDGSRRAVGLHGGVIRVCDRMHGPERRWPRTTGCVSKAEFAATETPG